MISAAPDSSSSKPSTNTEDRLANKLGHLAAEQTLHHGATLPIDELIPHGRLRLPNT